MTDDLIKRVRNMMGVKPSEPAPKKYQFAPGYTRCMDCRCRGNGECKGENRATRDAWRAIMDRG